MCGRSCIKSKTKEAHPWLRGYGSHDLCQGCSIASVDSTFSTRTSLARDSHFSDHNGNRTFVQTFVEARVGIIYAEAGHSSRWEGVKAGGAPRVQDYVHSHATFLAGVKAKTNAAAVYCTAVRSRMGHEHVTF
jgi:hypothetical protein